MKKITLLIFITMLVGTNLVACTSKASISNNTKNEESFIKSGSSDSEYVELHKIKDNLWVHTTYSNYNGFRTSSNGIIAVTLKGLILIDTPWNNPQTRKLIELTERVFKKDISFAIITHAHDDRMGGIDTLIEKNIDTKSINRTVKEAEKKGYKKPRTVIDPDAKITWEDFSIEVLYPGEGHTVDNITVWFPESKVLFGGCLIKSLESKDIGNIEDANIKEWPGSVNKVLMKYSDAEIVIPGHGKWGNLELLEHTKDLF